MSPHIGSQRNWVNDLTESTKTDLLVWALQLGGKFVILNQNKSKFYKQGEMKSNQYSTATQNSPKNMKFSMELMNTYDSIACGKCNAGCVVVPDMTLKMTSPIMMLVFRSGTCITSMTLNCH